MWFVVGGKKKNVKKQQKAPSHLSPLLTFLPHTDHHLSLAGQCIDIYFCSECCCTSVVSLWTTLSPDKKTKKTKGKQITAAWVSSLIHTMSWWCQPRCEFNFALPVVSDGDRGGNYSTFKEPLRPGTGRVAVSSYIDNKKNKTKEKTKKKTQRQLDVDTDSRPILTIPYELVREQRQSHRYLLLDSSICNQNMKPNDSTKPQTVFKSLSLSLNLSLSLSLSHSC